MESVRHMCSQRRQKKQNGRRTPPYPCPETKITSTHCAVTEPEKIKNNTYLDVKFIKRYMQCLRYT